MARPQAFLFDVFGTLVDWRGSIARQMRPYLPEAGQAGAFADAWRALYQPAMERVRSGVRPFVALDTLHRENLDAILPRFGLGDTSDAERDAINAFWHTLDGWPDTAAGLEAFAQRGLIAPHSNGNVRLMVDMARHNGWRWDAILGAEVTGHYKPQPDSYLTACAMLMLPPGEVMMVAAHNDDLAAAAACGLQTGFVPRPAEHGSDQTVDTAPTGDWTVTAPHLPTLAQALAT